MGLGDRRVAADPEVEHGLVLDPPLLGGAPVAELVGAESEADGPGLLRLQADALEALELSPRA